MQYREIKDASKQQLLNTRVCDLEIDLRQTPLMRGINQLYFELNDKLINFLPHIWLSDDWFCPDGISGFAIPFYLTHPRLIQLEQEQIGFVEGATHLSLMKLLRHETAHALDNAFYLRKKRKRQMLFGLTSKNYPKTYLPNPHSKNYVRHLEDHYAQSHPDEDWAETFAVWLNPYSNWQEKYAKWQAYEKLKLVDNTFDQLQQQIQLNHNKSEVDPIHLDTRTLKEYFQDKKKDLRLNRYRPLIKKIDSHHLSYVLENKKEVKEILVKKRKVHPFVATKLLKDLNRECKREKINLSYNKRINKTLLERQLQNLTQEYIKQGRHRIVM